MVNEENKVGIEERTFQFALMIIDIYKFLCMEKKEFILAKQLLRSGTSIGANIQEAQAAQSRKDFLNKMSIASKEARETHYWLKLLKESDFLTGYKKASILFEEINAIINILTKIVKTTSNSLKTKNPKLKKNI